MDPALPTQSPDKSGVKPSFRKRLHDATSRKYRRHTPIGGSESSSSEGSPKRRSRSPVYSVDLRRKDDGREVERDSNHNRSSHRHSDRQSYGISHDSVRNNDYSRHHRHADEEDRSSHRSSRSGRESRSGGFDHMRHDSNSDRSREIWRSGDKHSREKSESVGHRSKDKDHRHNDKDSDRAASGSRQIDLSRDDVKTGERDRHRDREARDERRDRRRSPGDYKNDRGSSRVELRGQAKNSTLGRESGSTRLKETLWSGNKEIDVPKKWKHDDRESDKRKEKYTREAEAELKNESNSLSSYREREERNERYLDKTVNVSDEQSSSKKHKLGHSEGGLLSKSIANAEDEKQSSSLKHVKEMAESGTVNQADTAQDLNAAKVAAMKAAELVNRNLVGGSYLSTDQKKKLLWGNKKNISTEEPQSGNRWDLQLFADRERQEKFNKLMGVKGDAIPEHRPDDKDGSLRAQDQEKLQMDLEKQYTAGLRRRDGRTVGLGL